MADRGTERLHALLIGVDDYDTRPLNGCVNDTELVQRFLIERLETPPSAIRRLIAPRAAGQRPPLAETDRPTRQNLVQALTELAGERVQRGDRVLVYYAGHGTTQWSREAEGHLEALVPLDYQSAGLLFDHELNRLLSGIAKASGDLTVILDCCHSAGAVRARRAQGGGFNTRFLPLPRERLSAQRPSPLGSPLKGEVPVPAGSPYTVLAACQADETAAECEVAAAEARAHGLLTYSLFHLLDRIGSEQLRAVRFCDVFHELKGFIARLSAQRPQILGPRERPIFGGPFVPQDVGLPVQQAADGGYTLPAGTLAGICKGAQLAVYGPQPLCFPPLDSADDLAARLCVLQIESASPISSRAQLLTGVPPGPLGPGARARLIRPGAQEPLHVELLPSVDPLIRRELTQLLSPERFLLVPPEDPGAEIAVGQTPGGDLFLADDLNGPDSILDGVPAGPLGVVPAGLAEDRAALCRGLRAGLAHYSQYVVPLRLYRSGGFSLPQPALAVRVLDASAPSARATMGYDARARREVARSENGLYHIRSGDAVAFLTHNLLTRTLYVSLLFLSMEGQVAVLESDVPLPGGATQIFWNGGAVGCPFELLTPEDRRFGIERLLVLATDQPGLDLTRLSLPDSLDDAIRAALHTKGGGLKVVRAPAGVHWTAVQALIQVSRR